MSIIQHPAESDVAYEAAMTPHASESVLRSLGSFALTNRYGQAITATMAATTIAFGQWIHQQDSLPRSYVEQCVDAGHDAVMLGDTTHFLGTVSKVVLRKTANDLVRYGSLGTEHISNDNWTWSELAATEKAERGYDMSPEALAAENSAIATYDKGKLVDHINYHGKACLAEPAPGVSNIVYVDGKNTVASYAGDNFVSMAQLVKLNPGLTGDPTQVLHKGQVLKTGTPDLSLFKRQMTEPTLYAVDKGDPKLGEKIRLANPASIAIVPGNHLLLPPVETTWMKEHKITVQDEQAQYKDSYNNLGVNQTVAPKETKPLIPQPNKPNTLGNLQLFELQSYGVPTKYAKMYVQYGQQYGVSPLILAGQGKQESGWQANPGVSSAGAIGIAQFMPGTWNEIKSKLNFPANASPLNPEYAIEAQAAYMQQLLANVKPYAGKASATELALAAYNLGLGKIEKYGGMPPASEIGNYVSNIINISHNISNVFVPLQLTDKLHETSTGQKVHEYVGKAAYFSQTDNRWAWDSYNMGHNSAYTIGLNGCQPTQAAIIFSTLSGRQITPVDMATFNKLNGYILADSLGGGTDGEAAIRGAANQFGYKVTDFPKRLTPDMKKFLDGGGLIAINGQDLDPNTPATPGGHDFVIRGYTADGKLLIADPDSYANSQKTWTEVQIFGPAGFVIGVTK